MIKAGVIGATGYAGAELVRLLLGHSDVELVFLASKSYASKRFSQIYKNYTNIMDEPLCVDDINAMADEVDVIFTATPQGYLSSLLTEQVLEKAKIIDLSADYRIKDVSIYEKWYGIEHKSPMLIEEAIYGLCEVNRESIKSARLIANPGCYTTCSILGAYPLIKEGVVDAQTLIIDAKSGTSGAGRGAKTDNLYCEVNESIKAYGVASHRHTPEIEEQLGYALGKPMTINFTPHLVPMNRGILATMYSNLTIDTKEATDTIGSIYKKYYGDEPFIRLMEAGSYPETKWVEGSNYLDIGFVVDERTNRVIIMSALDNLIKGAAGQAMQNMNIMFGIEETKGLMSIPMYP